MEHPALVEPGDPLVQRVRELCLRFPESVEVRAWGRPTFRAGKRIFATVGSSMDRPHSIVFKPDSEERLAFLEDPRFFVPPYFGPSGWLAIDFGEGCDWQQLAELLDTSYRQVALKRQLVVLDARGWSPADAR
ncbi:MmcQ/YjbR family DNA-binding protein [Compostimonas suwonensis]|uniref:Putative DNA-binding protein (MmcQ/YjbR family) n=1 Tax=Compostimonas suwonensis TaxID=1048394 RepID=A0A2M9C3E8_9MICO|nr:MmcQ/YjbR family DNA-binding protein [Compostimonas suwonensis]PJJ65064.1 putative DNA-binding protein (MmcQ/YjbR family) [Compostimonas suwonensis]